jgi:hypothetical protein
VARPARCPEHPLYDYVVMGSGAYLR